MDAPSDIRRGEAERAAGDADHCPSCHAPVDGSWLACASCGNPLAVEAELPSGALLSRGQFEVVEPIGRGGFGITYEATDHRLQRRVAVKELFPDSAVRHGSMVLTPPLDRPAFREARERFLREARVLARFTDPGIVRVYEVFEEHNTAYMVMELLEGRNLLELLRARGEPFSEAELLDVASRAAAALRPVHAAGVLHRDINPSNIVLSNDGRIVVIDFGLARSFLSDHSTPFTKVMTPGYAPLEQYLDDTRIGPPSDVYGLAATLYRLATERIPTPAVERQSGADLPAPHRLNPAISKVVSDALLDGLELHVDHRPRTLDAFLRRLGLAHAARPPRSLLLDAMPPPRPPPPGPLVVVVDGGPTVLGRPGARDDRTELERPSARDDRTELERPSARDDRTELERPGASDDRTELERPSPSDDRTELERPVVRPAPAPPAAPVPDDVGTAGTRPPPPPTVWAAPAPPGPGPATAYGVAPPRVELQPSARWKLTVPVGVAVFAVASAAPIVAIALIVLVALPLLATWGDATVHRARREAGTPRTWLERAGPPGAVAPVRLVANLLVSALRAAPVVALTAALLGLCYGLDRLDVPQPLLDATIRGVGLLAAALLVLPARHGSTRFRTGIGIDDLSGRLLGPGGQLGQRGLVVWVVAAFLTTAALWFQPELWPFRL